MVGDEPRIERLDDGLLQLESQHLRLVTDLPLDSHIQDLPRVFDAAVNQWCQAFGINQANAVDAKATAYVMVDRERFIRLGVLDTKTTSFRHGYQIDDSLYLNEQPSPYYRRHLLLHEGTHWFLWKFLGGNGPPWLSEGLSEFMGTHLWDGVKLTMGIVPRHADDVPFWGRIKMIRDGDTNGMAPSLDAILAYDGTAHRQDAPYAWSWLAVNYFQHHPRYSQAFRECCQKSLMGEADVAEYWNAEVKKSRSQSLREWKLFVDEADYGFDPARTIVSLEPSLTELVKHSETTEARCEVRSDRGWQNTGLFLQAGQSVQVSAKGHVVIRQANRLSGEPEWFSQPNGITLEYYRGKPIGKLIAIVVPSSDDDAAQIHVRDWQHLDLEAENGEPIVRDGIVLLRINENSSQLFDNQGSYVVDIHIR